MLTKIIIKYHVPRDYFVIISARMVPSMTIGTQAKLQWELGLQIEH